MAILPIVTEGTPSLRQKSKPIKKITPDLLTLIRDMEATMYAAHGVGLAAPQVGVNRRLIVMDVQDGEGLRVMVNPEIIAASGEELGLEGCLSVPGYEGLVKRAAEVTVKWTAIDRSIQTLDCTGLLARCVQHEIDHLDGILYIDKVVGGLRPAGTTPDTGPAI